jgi:hypothetical protein
MAGDAMDQFYFLTTLGTPAAPAGIDIKQKVVQLVAARPNAGTVKSIFNPRARSLTSIVRYAGAEMSRRDPKQKMFPALAFWQLCSGLSHARPWAFLAGLDRSGAVVDPDGKAAHVAMSSSTVNIAGGLITGVDLLEFALQCYGQRARAWTALPEDVQDPNYL